MTQRNRRYGAHRRGAHGAHRRDDEAQLHGADAVHVNAEAPGAVIAGCPSVHTRTIAADKPLTLRGAQRVWTAVPGGPTWRGVGHLTATAARVP